MEADFLTITLRLVLSVVLGGIIGYQREAVDRPAGFRTHVLVAVGSALITLVSIFGFEGADKARVAAQIVTGIGFLGAGTIIRQGSIVRGLTTAASIWAVAGVGMAAGAGFYAGALVSTVLIFLVLSYGKRMEQEFIPRVTTRNLFVRGENKPGQLGRIDAILEREGIILKKVDVAEESDGEVLVKLEVSLPPNADTEYIRYMIGEVQGVSEVSWEE